MPWFKVDDDMPSHPKFINLSSTALGVWTRVGAHCARYLTEGFVDERIVGRLMPDPPRVVAAAIGELVEAGLWERVEGGWQYHDWCQYQPSRAQIEAERTAARERQRRGRERQRARRENANVTP